MSSDVVDIPRGGKRAKFCPYCGSDNVMIWDFLVKCHKCYRMSSAMDMDLEEMFEQ